MLDYVSHEYLLFYRIINETLVERFKLGYLMCSFQRKNIFIRILSTKNDIIFAKTIKADYSHYLYKTTEIQRLLGLIVNKRYRLQLERRLIITIKKKIARRRYIIKFLRGFLKNQNLRVKHIFFFLLKSYNGCHYKKKRRKKRKSRGSKRFKMTRFKYTTTQGKWPSGQRRLF